MDTRRRAAGEKPSRRTAPAVSTRQKLRHRLDGRRGGGIPPGDTAEGAVRQLLPLRRAEAVEEHPPLSLPAVEEQLRVLPPHLPTRSRRTAAPRLPVGKQPPLHSPCSRRAAAPSLSAVEEQLRVQPAGHALLDHRLGVGVVVSVS